MSTYLTLDEAADYLRVSVPTIKRAIYSTGPNRLVAKKTGAGGGGKYLIRVSDLDAWFDGLVDA